MAKIYLDTNYLIDVLIRRQEQEILASLETHSIYISPLSFHIYCYIFHIKIPDKKVTVQRDFLHIVDFSEDILDRALQGPRADLEDNIQLHGGAEAECAIFLTVDKRLLKLEFFGKMRIVSSLQL